MRYPEENEVMADQDDDYYDSEESYYDDEENWRAEDKLQTEAEIAEWEAYLDRNLIGFEDFDFDEEC